MAAERQYKYTEEMHQAIVQAIREGASRTMAFKLQGMHPDTVFDWLRKGREKSDTYPQYLRLNDDIDKAEAEFLKEQVDAVRRTAQGTTPQSFAAASFLLERRAPEDFGRRDKVQVDPPEGGPLIQLNQVVLVDTDAREAARDVLRRVAGPRPDVTIGPGVRGELEEKSESRRTA